MIHFITGNPGGGKSFFSVRQIIFELEHTERVIVTNLALDLEALAEYCQKQGIDYGLHLNQRIQKLDAEQVQHFYQYRGENRPPLPMIKTNMLEYEIPDFERVAQDDKGVFYAIDEVHLYYGARQWYKTGEQVIYYLSQHRKLSDDVFLISQHPDQVDKALKRLAQDWTYLRNLGQEKTLGFTAKNWLRRSTYLRQKAGKDGQSAQETGMVKLDISGICQLYKTNEGVGIVGRVDAKKESKVRGFPWWTAPFFFIAGIAALWLIIHFGFSGIRWGMRTALESKTDAVASSSVVEPPSVKEGGEEKNENSEIDRRINTLLGALSNRVDRLSDRRFESQRVFLSRVVILGSDRQWELSDGRVITPDAPSFRGGGEDWVFLQDLGMLRRRGLSRAPSFPQRQSVTDNKVEKETGTKNESLPIKDNGYSGLQTNQVRGDFERILLP